MQLLKGFKDFISRGNAVDMAVGIVIGGAFGAIVTGLVDGIITPLIAAVFGEPDIKSVGSFTINNAHFSFGLVFDAIFKFLCIAAAIYFLVIVPMNKLMGLRKQAEDAPAGPSEIELLQEIRDALKK